LTRDRLRHTLPLPVMLVSAAVALSLLGDSLLYAVVLSQAEAMGVPKSTAPRPSQQGWLATIDLQGMETVIQPLPR
jgi:hypothetical protein